MVPPTSSILRNPRISTGNAAFATIIVGNDKQAFTVHEQLLTHHSTFFRTALTRKFEEPENKEVLLADTRPYIFEFFIHWLYYGRFPNEDDDTELVELWTCHNNSGKTKTNNLIRLYIFCHRYDVPQLKVRAIDELFDHMENEDLEAKLPCSSITTEAYDTLPEGSNSARSSKKV